MCYFYFFPFQNRESEHKPPDSTNGDINSLKRDSVSVFNSFLMAG